MAFQECANFTLKTCDLGNNVYNTYGFSSSTNNLFIWTNFNLKQALGTLWDKYDTYRLTLMVSAATALSGTPATNDDKLPLIKLTGFQYLNCNYDQRTGQKTPYTYVGVQSFLQSNFASSQFYNFTNSITILKGDPFINIQIELEKVSNNTLATTSVGTFPQQAFIFRIDGIPKQKQ